jgi:hypothetical protein
MQNVTFTAYKGPDFHFRQVPVLVDVLVGMHGWRFPRRPGRAAEVSGVMVARRYPDTPSRHELTIKDV